MQQQYHIDKEVTNMYNSYWYSDCNVYNMLVAELSKCNTVGTKTKYLTACCGFDIETTNIQKLAFMYCWQFGIGLTIIKGRKWEQFEELIELINYIIDCIDAKASIIVWDANLPYEFQFLRKRFKWSKIFAKKNRQILTANYKHIEFRECLSISGQGGLANLAKNFCTTQKANGDLDYTQNRNSVTPFDKQENHYIDNDVIILIEWAQYVWNNLYKHYKKIPLTITQTIRWDMKNEIGDGVKSVYNAIRTLYPKTDKEYKYIMRWLFRGGYVHSNVIYTGVTLRNVTGIDFTSSYPAVMCHGYYPVSRFVPIQNITHQDVTKLLQTKCCIMTVKFWNIRSTTSHSIESSSKCIELCNPIIDNGRIHSADYIKVMLTELDYQTYKQFYKWDKMEIVDMQISKRGKLPDYLINTMLLNYVKKCQLKQAGESDTIEYINAKAKTNSFYGCTVTQLNFEEYGLDDSNEWCISGGNDYNTIIRHQILSSYWGVYVTAHARRNLFKMLYILRDYAIYCDTDSIYYLANAPENITVKIGEWNNQIDAINKRQYPDMYQYVRDLGAFDKIGEYTKFKTLGAKRYIKYGHDTGKSDKLHVTVAGLPKKDFEEYINNNHEDAFEAFNNNMQIPDNICSKLLRTYNDNYTELPITDKYGTTEIMCEESSVALSPTTFKLTMSTLYLRMIDTYMSTFRSDIKNARLETNT